MTSQTQNRLRKNLPLPAGVTLDPRRALFLQQTKTLVVADLHLGYAWVHRQSGHLLPVSAPEDSLVRLRNLIKTHTPEELVLLGDIVHRAVAVDELKRELCDIIHTLSGEVRLVLVAGNHDRRLKNLLLDCGLDAPIRSGHRAGDHLLIHGDGAGTPTESGLTVVGHEHPAITLFERPATNIKCACFVLSDKVIMLPAFSRWAAGTDIRTYARDSRWFRTDEAVTAFAIMGDKLLPIPLRL